MAFKTFTVDKLGAGGKANAEAKKLDSLVAVDKLVLGAHALGKFHIFAKADTLVLPFGSLVYCNVTEPHGIWPEAVIDATDGPEPGGISESKAVGVRSCPRKVDYE